MKYSYETKQTGPEAEGKLLPGLFGQGIMD
jgi:hypothetical protein